MSDVTASRMSETESNASMVVLHPDDPFDAALIPIVLTNRRKRADYAVDGDPFSNFRETAEEMDFDSPVQSADFNVVQKQARLKALRRNKRAPENEAVIDTYLDRAVYSIIAYALMLEDLTKDKTRCLSTYNPAPGRGLVQCTHDADHLGPHSWQVDGHG